MNICVRNLSQDITEKDLREAFEDFGKVSGVTIANGKHGHKEMMAYVNMPVENEAHAAITYLDGVELKGRHVNVTPAEADAQDDSLEDEYSEYEEEFEEDDEDNGRGRPKKKKPGEPERW